MHYKIIFLIISSDDVPVYAPMRNLLSKYLDLYKEQVHYLFIENREQEEMVVEKDHFLYCQGVESIIPGIMKKSLKSMEYIDGHYSFDFVIRTNVSSFWNMENLLKCIESVPKTRFAGGFTLHDSENVCFITGTGIILSKDLCPLLASHSADNRIESVYDDVLISVLLVENNIPLTNVNNYRWEYSINDNALNENTDFSQVLNFRNKNGDRNIDIQNFRMLLKKLYSIEVD